MKLRIIWKNWAAIDYINDKPIKKGEEFVEFVSGMMVAGYSEFVKNEKQFFRYKLTKKENRIEIKGGRNIKDKKGVTKRIEDAFSVSSNLIDTFDLMLIWEWSENCYIR